MAITLTENQKLDLMRTFYLAKDYNDDYDNKNEKWNKLREAMGVSLNEFSAIQKMLIDLGMIESINNRWYISTKGKNFPGFELTELRERIKEQNQGRLLELTIKDLETKDKKNIKNQWRTLWFTLISGSISVTLGWYLKTIQLNENETPIIQPKIQLVRDTITVYSVDTLYIKDERPNKKGK